MSPKLIFPNLLRWRLIAAICLLHFIPFTRAQAQGQNLVLPEGHGRRVEDLTFSPDGRKLYSTDYDNLFIWDTFSGSLIERISHNPFSVFSTDRSKLFICKAGAGKILISNSAVASCTLDNKKSLQNIYAAAFSPDGNALLTATTAEVKIWDTRTGAAISPIGEVNDLEKRTFKFSPDSKFVCVTRMDNSPSYSIYEVKTGNKVFGLKKEALEMVTAMAFYPKSDLFLVALRNLVTGKCMTLIYDILNNKVVKQLDLGGSVSYILIDQTGSQVFFSIRDDMGYHAKVWSMAGNHFTSELVDSMTMNSNGHLYRINSIMFGPVDSALFSQDGSRILTFHGDMQYIRIWNASTGKRTLAVPDNSAARDFGLTQKFSVNFRVNEQMGPSPWQNSGNFEIIDVGKAKAVDSIMKVAEHVVQTGISPDGYHFAAAYEDYTIKLWDIRSKEISADYKNHTLRPDYYEVRPDNKKIAIKIGATAKFMDVETASYPLNDKEYMFNVKILKYSPDGNRIYTVNGSEIDVWSAGADTILMHLRKHTGQVFQIALTRDGSKLVSTSADGTIKLWDTGTGRTILDFKVYPAAESCRFSVDDKLIISQTASKGYVFDPGPQYKGVWEVATGRLLQPGEIDISSEFHYGASNKWEDKLNRLSANVPGQIIETILSHNRKKVIIIPVTGKPVVTNADAFTPVPLKLKDNLWTSKARFSQDDQTIFTFNADASVSIWDPGTGSEIRNFRDAANPFTGFSLSPDEKKVITTSDNNGMKIWDVEKASSKYNFYAIDSVNYFAQVPSGYYQCTPAAAGLLHYLTRNKEIISFEQLDLKYNRPDRVLEAIGSTNKALIKDYKLAYVKRLKRLGIDSSSLKGSINPPRVELLNKNELLKGQPTERIRLHIRAQDDSSSLSRFNVWVNHVPVFGIRGIDLTRKHSGGLDTTILLQLGRGRNRIEAAVTNKGGTESFREPLYLNYAGNPGITPTLYFVGIGIDHFADSKFNLQWSVSDIRKLASSLAKKYGKNMLIDTLFNSAVTTAKVKLIKAFLKNSKVDDKVIIAYSGHGLVSADRDYYLSTYNVNFFQPASGGLPYEDLEDLMDGVAARKKLMLIDACHSGEIDKDDIVQIQNKRAVLKREKVGFRGVGDNIVSQIGTHSVFEIMRLTFANLERNTGTEVIAAATGAQLAGEDYDLKNGIFTSSILEAIDRNEHENISALKTYVGFRVAQLSHGLQTPTTRSEAEGEDWVVW